MGTVQTLIPPRCPPMEKVTDYKPLNDELFVKAPEPQKMSETDEYGDYSGVLREARTSIQEYNFMTLENIKKSVRNQDSVIDSHNKKIDELNKNCEKLWEEYEHDVLGYKK